MTLCVAAISANDRIIGASDRMLTTGITQFEPTQSKVFPLTSAIALMTAGDTHFQTDVRYRLQTEVARRIAANPDDWLRIEDVANFYSYYVSDIRRMRAEKEILAPLGMTGETFLQRQQSLTPSLVHQLAEALRTYKAPATEAIICGIDSTGPHIYSAFGDQVACNDFEGFASIGSGAWHSNSQMMVSGHAKTKGVPETLLAVYIAKKRAEVAPGVGKATDMIIVGPQLGSYHLVELHVLDSLESFYQQTQKQVSNVAKRADAKVRQFIQAMTQRPAEQIAPPPTEQPAEPPTTHDAENTQADSETA